MKDRSEDRCPECGSDETRCPVYAEQVQIERDAERAEHYRELYEDIRLEQHLERRKGIA